jgi:hypothetical protein
MRDPDLVKRAERAAIALERAWGHWRIQHGFGGDPPPPVSSYVGYSLEEPWGQPRVVFGVGADEAEKLAAVLEGHDCVGPVHAEVTGRPDWRRAAAPDPAEAPKWSFDVPAQVGPAGIEPTADPAAVGHATVEPRAVADDRAVDQAGIEAAAVEYAGVDVPAVEYAGVDVPAVEAGAVGAGVVESAAAEPGGTDSAGDLSALAASTVTRPPLPRMFPAVPLLPVAGRSSVTDQGQSAGSEQPAMPGIVAFRRRAEEAPGQEPEPAPLAVADPAESLDAVPSQGPGYRGPRYQGFPPQYQPGQDTDIQAAVAAAARADDGSAESDQEPPGPGRPLQVSKLGRTRRSAPGAPEPGGWAPQGEREQAATDTAV